MYLAYDIETAENEQAAAYYDAKEYTPDPALSPVDQIPSRILELKSDDLRNQRAADWKLEQAAKIETSIQSRRTADRGKAAISWWTAKIICICIEDDQGKRKTFNNVDERQLLCDFFATILADYYNHTLIGKSSEDFDKPFVVGRALFHDIGLIPHFRTRDEITDVNQIFGHKGNSQITSLANYAWGFALGSKGGKGSDVGDWYKAGLHDVIADYCAQDVSLVSQILKRWRTSFG
jgi:predicted PolB exonuclease-like 3'-5' exonuclease